MRIRTALALGSVAIALAGPVAGAPLAPPVTISEQAQDFYRQLGTRPPSSGAYDAAAMERMRTGLGKMFLANARRIRTDYELERVDANGVPAYWVKIGKPEPSKRVLLYIHGGGFMLGGATTNLGIPLRAGPAAGTSVLSVEYRLAPEHPFPAAVDDSLAAYRWLLAQGYRGRQIALIGDSAGGGLVLSLALAVRDAKLPMPAAIVALSPAVDLTGAGDTRITLAGADPIVVGDPTPRFALYTGKDDPRNPLISPLYADLRGLPPLLIQVGTREVLLSDAVRLARRAREAGVDVTLDVWEGMWHVWQEHATAPEAVQASAEIGRFVKEKLDGK